MISSRKCPTCMSGRKCNFCKYEIPIQYLEIKNGIEFWTCPKCNTAMQIWDHDPDEYKNKIQELINRCEYFDCNEDIFDRVPRLHSVIREILEIMKASNEYN